MLKLEDRWVWDFWFAHDGDDIHVFHLQAPRSLGHPDLRHAAATVGHAVSQDLRSWRELPTALGPGEPGAWDESTTWTGSVVRDDDGTWWMFYTGTSRGEEFFDQAVGAATSRDLVTWTKPFDHPLVVVDPELYEALDASHDSRLPCWRDPWVMRHPETGVWHMLLTARAPAGPLDARGVIGHASSTDLVTWEVRPALTAPSDFAHMECPQVVELEGRWYLVYSVYEWAHSTSRLRRAAATRGTHYQVGDGPLGPFRPLLDDFLTTAHRGEGGADLYCGKIVEDPLGGWALMAFGHDTPGGEFVGHLENPVPVRVTEGGRLRLAPERVA